MIQLSLTEQLDDSHHVAVGGLEGDLETTSMKPAVSELMGKEQTEKFSPYS